MIKEQFLSILLNVSFQLLGKVRSILSLRQITFLITGAFEIEGIVSYRTTAANNIKKENLSRMSVYEIYD